MESNQNLVYSRNTFDGHFKAATKHTEHAQIAESSSKTWKMWALTGKTETGVATTVRVSYPTKKTHLQQLSFSKDDDVLLLRLSECHLRRLGLAVKIQLRQPCSQVLEDRGHHLVEWSVQKT